MIVCSTFSMIITVFAIIILRHSFEDGYMRPRGEYKQINVKNQIKIFGKGITDAWGVQDASWTARSKYAASDTKCALSCISLILSEFTAA